MNKLNKLELKKFYIDKIELKLVGHHFIDDSNLIGAIRSLCSINKFDAKQIYDMLIKLLNDYKNAGFYNYGCASDIVNLLNNVEEKDIYGLDYKYYILIAHFGHYGMHKNYGKQNWKKLVACDMNKLLEIVTLLGNGTKSDVNAVDVILKNTEKTLFSRISKLFG